MVKTGTPGKKFLKKEKEKEIISRNLIFFPEVIIIFRKSEHFKQNSNFFFHYSLLMQYFNSVPATNFITKV